MHIHIYIAHNNRTRTHIYIYARARLLGWIYTDGIRVPIRILLEYNNKNNKKITVWCYTEFYGLKKKNVHIDIQCSCGRFWLWALGAPSCTLGTECSRRIWITHSLWSDTVFTTEWFLLSVIRLKFGAMWRNVYVCVNVDESLYVCCVLLYGIAAHHE